MHAKPFLLFILLLSFACNNNASPGGNRNTTGINRYPDENPYSNISKIPLPEGFEREIHAPSSFANYLNTLGLKKDKTVYLFNGQPKWNQAAQFAILDIPVGNKDLQQCADAVMRMRAEYLFKQESFNEIVFFDNDHTAYKFSPPFSRENFLNYLNRVFGMCGSASLSKQLKTVDNFDNIEPGDVLIRGGFPGHAVMVMDVAVNKSGEKIYLLAQSYMPAQDIHILKNPMNENLSPWYEVNDNNLIETPEYTFTRSELKRW
jgi:hypothetical protein